MTATGTPASVAATSIDIGGTPTLLAGGLSEALDEGPELTVVMPCLNEAETIERCITKAQGWMAARGVRGEVVIGDNGSTDGSIEMAERLGARVVRVPQRGYGAALDGAIRAARGRYVIMGDSDDSYDFSSLDAFVEKLRGGWELVMGNRFAGGIKPGAMPWKNRYVGNPVLSWVGRTLFGIRERDFHCGIRGFARDAYPRMQLATTGMEYASEMVIKAYYFDLRTTEVPTVLWPDGRSRPPHLRPWRDGWRHLRFMLLFAPRWLFLYPGLLLIAAGLAGMVALATGPVQLGRVTLDVHTLLFAGLAVLVGYQAITFGVLAKVIAIRIGAHPVTPRSERFERTVSVEAALIAGGVLAVAGVALLWAAVSSWLDAGMGALDPSRTMRELIPGAVLLVVGLQTALAGMLLGVVRLPTRLRAA